jgi:hypothetical protein
MASCCASVSGVAACACVRVAELDWSERSKCTVAKPVDDVASRNVSRPSHITVLKKRKFVEGSGRRKSDSSSALANPYGSCTDSSSNSAPAGMPFPIRIRARSRRRLNALRRARSVETSAVGEVEPSTVRKSGSSPAVCSNRSCTKSGVMVIPDPGTWQVLQERPFVPSDWKNGLLGSFSGPPLALMVSDRPKRFGASASSGAVRNRTCRLDSWTGSAGRAGSPNLAVEASGGVLGRLFRLGTAAERADSENDVIPWVSRERRKGLEPLRGIGKPGWGS